MENSFEERKSPIYEKQCFSRGIHLSTSVMAHHRILSSAMLILGGKGPINYCRYFKKPIANCAMIKLHESTKIPTCFVLGRNFSIQIMPLPYINQEQCYIHL
jgi:hypothetical protein